MSKGQRVGYVRVSSIDQNTERQTENMQVDQLFIDRTSGKDVKRPELERMMGYLRQGDTLVVYSIDRLARNLIDLRSLVQDLISKGIRVEFIKEHLAFTDEPTPTEALILSLMGSFAEFERNILLERQREGIALAKARGAYKGRKKTLSPEQAQIVKQKVQLGVAVAKVARELGVCRQTLYRYLKES